jgi:hypothetical protein
VVGRHRGGLTASIIDASLLPWAVPDVRFAQTLATPDVEMQAGRSSIPPQLLEAQSKGLTMALFARHHPGIQFITRTRGTWPCDGPATCDSKVPQPGAMRRKFNGTAP